MISDQILFGYSTVYQYSLRVGGTVEEPANVVTGLLAERGAHGQPEDALVLAAEADEGPHRRLGAALGHRPQELAALREADGVVALGQPLVLQQLLAYPLHLLVGMDEEAALPVQDRIAANLQGPHVAALCLLHDEAHDGAQTEGHAAGVAHAVPQDHGQDIRIGAAGRRLPPLVDHNQERDQQHDQRLSFAAHYSCRYDILS